MLLIWQNIRFPNHDDQNEEDGNDMMIIVRTSLKKFLMMVKTSLTKFLMMVKTYLKKFLMI